MDNDKLFYIVYVMPDDMLEGDIPPLELTDEQFREIAMQQENVYTLPGLVEAWNKDDLPVFDSYIRYLPRS